MTPDGRRRLLSLARYLRVHIPPGKPVRLVLGHTLPDDHGYASGQNCRTWKIAISADEDDLGALDTLIHEWAHCLAGWKSRRVHTNRWGSAYSRCYRVFLEWLASRSEYRGKTKTSPAAG